MFEILNSCGPDGSTIGVGETFIKKWRVKNTGSCTWDSQYRWDFSSDEENQNNFGRDGFPFEGSVGPGQEFEIVQQHIHGKPEQLSMPMND